MPREEGNSSRIGAHLLPIRRMDSGDSCLSARSYCYDHRGNSCITSTSLSCEIKSKMGTSLVVQGLGVCLPMQGTQVCSLVQEGSAQHKATMPRATTMSLDSGTRKLQLLKPAHPTAHVPQQEKPPQGKGHGPQRREQPPLAATRESLHKATKTQCSQK